MADFLTAAEAARRLGVKPATLYAYVSRGVLTRTRATDALPEATIPGQRAGRRNQAGPGWRHHHGRTAHRRMR